MLILGMKARTETRCVACMPQVLDIDTHYLQLIFLRNIRLEDVAKRLSYQHLTGC